MLFGVGGRGSGVREGGEARHADGQEVAGVREEEQLKTKERRRSREEKLEKRRCKGKKSVAVKNSSE